MKPVNKVISKLSGVKKTTKGWLAECPAHDDRRASLSISEGDDGRALIKCHAGCSFNAICSAAGLSPTDLFEAPTASTSTQLSQLGKKQGLRGRDQSQPATTTFATAQDALAVLEHRHGPCSAKWTYYNNLGQPVGMVLRWDLPDGKKDIKPVSQFDDGWRIAGMPEPRPLYALPELVNATRVYVVEGEKAADAARSIGLVATTSVHGSQSPDKTDWGPLADKEVIIVPDNDEAGRKYADAVVAILARLQPAPLVKLVELPNLPAAGDIADWVDAHGDTAEPESMRAEIKALVGKANLQLSSPDVPLVFQPFPVDALPEPVRSLVTVGAKAIGCDPSYLALPMLAMLAAAIGNSRRLRLKRAWTVPAIIWAAIVGESGTSKTPAFKLVMKAIRKRQQRAMKQHAVAMLEYEADLAHYEKELAAWKKNKVTSEPPPEKPEEPQAERCVVSDTTVEAMVPLLLANPRGLLMARDELAGWVGSFDRYAGGKGGADSAHWLSMHNGESFINDRKTGTQRAVYVPMASVSVCGGIQPGILIRVMGIEHRESGLFARLLLACPPRHSKRWTDADIDPAVEDAIVRLVERLFELQLIVDADGESQPVIVGLTPEAKKLWVSYYNAHAQEQVDMAGDLSAAWSKLEENAARLALVFHFVRWAAGDTNLRSADAVDAESMEAGIRVTEWFKREARRVYAMLGETDGERDQRRLVEWIGRKGGVVKAREVQGGCRWLREPGAAEVALDKLVKAGAGCWRDIPTTAKGGHPTRAFVLTAASVVNKTPTNCGDGVGSVDVDNVDAAETQAPGDDWGKL